MSRDIKKKEKFTSLKNNSFLPRSSRSSRRISRKKFENWDFLACVEFSRPKLIKEGNARCNFVDLAYRGGFERHGVTQLLKRWRNNIGEKGDSGPFPSAIMQTPFSWPSPLDRSISGPSLPLSSPQRPQVNRWIASFLDFSRSREFFTVCFLHDGK